MAIVKDVTDVLLVPSEAVWPSWCLDFIGLLHY